MDTGLGRTDLAEASRARASDIQAVFPAVFDAAPAAVRPSVVVLGAGISGLVAARLLARQGAAVTLVEPYRQAGGNHLSVAADGMVFDIGAIHFNDDDAFFESFPELKALCLPRVIKAQKLSPDGRIRRYPMEASDLVGQGPLFGLKAAASLVAGRLRPGGAKTAADYVERRVGRFFFRESGLRTYVSRLFGCEAERIDAEFGERRLGWLARRSSLRRALAGLPSAWRRRDRPAAPQALSLVRPAGGFGPYYAAAVAALEAEGVDVRLGTALRRIARTPAGMAVETDGERVLADRVVSTLPIRLVSDLCGQPAPDLASVDLLSLFVAFRGERGFAATVLFNFHESGDWKRITVGSDLYGRRFGEDYATIEIPLRDAALTPDAAFERFQRAVTDAGLFQGTLRLVGHHRLGEAYPLLDRGCTARRAEAVSRLQAAGVEGIGRQGRFEYIPHQCVAAREAVALLSQPAAPSLALPETTMPMSVEILSPADLSPQQIERWRAFQAADPLLQSPFLTPDFVQLVAEIRPNVRVAVIDGGRTGFLAFRRSGGVGRPVAGAADDCQALIAAADARIDMRDLLAQAGLKVLDFTHARAGQAALRPFHRKLVPSHTIDLSGGFEAYLAERRASRRNLLTDLNARRRRLERELGPCDFVFHDATPATLDRLIDWKNLQYRKLGIGDFGDTPWMIELLQRLQQVEGPDFAGVLSTLSFGGRLVAAHMGIRSASVLHQWFPTYDPAFGKHSPGLVLMMEMCRASAEAGLAAFELGAGHEDYKGRFANTSILLASGFAGRPSLPLFRRRALEEAGRLAARLPMLGPAGRWPERLLHRMALS